MSIEVSIPKDKVDEARKVLDEHADHPPWICTNEMLPDTILLKYDLPKTDGFAILQNALGNGWSVNRT